VEVPLAFRKYHIRYITQVLVGHHRPLHKQPQVLDHHIFLHNGWQSILKPQIKRPTLFSVRNLLLIRSFLLTRRVLVSRLFALTCVLLAVKHAFLQVLEVCVFEVTLDCLAWFAVLKLARDHLDLTFCIVIVFFNCVLKHLNDCENEKPRIFDPIAEHLMPVARLHIMLHHKVHLQLVEGFHASVKLV
jgi:hypothetical protein